MNKSSIKEIKDRFDQDVERFTSLEKGQTSTVDARLSLDLISEAAEHLCPNAKDLLDVGCGAGNYSLKLLEKLPDLNISLVDLSPAMLRKAFERVGPATQGNVSTICEDIKNLKQDKNSFDIIVAGAVLHHLREEAEWNHVYSKFYQLLRPGGILLISDLVVHSLKAINQLIWDRYKSYLKNLGGEEYQKHVFAYIQMEDSPRSYEFQREILLGAGFNYVEILHKNMCFATFCAIKEKSNSKFEILSPGETDQGII